MIGMLNNNSRDIRAPQMLSWFDDLKSVNQHRKKYEIGFKIFFLREN